MGHRKAKMNDQNLNYEISAFFLTNFKNPYFPQRNVHVYLCFSVAPRPVCSAKSPVQRQMIGSMFTCLRDESRERSLYQNALVNPQKVRE